MEPSFSRLEYLYDLWCRQELTEQEREEYFALLEKYSVDGIEPFMKRSWDAAQDENTFAIGDRYQLAARILAEEQNERETATPVFSLARFTHTWRWVAAVIILLLGSGTYFVFYHRTKPDTLTASGITVPDVAPGKDGAILTLADGTRKVLDNVENGIVSTQNGTDAVIKNGQLVYQHISADLQTGEVLYNTMSTPRGRQFRLCLPDGTNVWLNAASSIRFPTAFTGNERSVEVAGEAYFEVAKDKTKPFRVHFLSSHNGTQGTVQALGTSFNVSVYQDDNAAKVTLVEGSVFVATSPKEDHKAILEPGEQASILYAGSLNALPAVQKVDTEKAIAWKNGILNLHNLGLADVMKQLSRWYDIDVEYRGAMPNITFWGEMSKNENLSTVLDFMAKSGVNFKIEDEGKKIIIITAPS